LHKSKLFEFRGVLVFSAGMAVLADELITQFPSPTVKLGVAT